MTPCEPFITEDMPGIGHIAVGLAAGRLHAGRGATSGSLAASMGGYALLSALPDADVLAFGLGIPYDAPFGHRGAVHSLAFGVLSAGVFCAVARTLGQPLRRTVPLALVVALSHPLLDTLTDGGRGIALLWPLSEVRLFAPWRPIPVAPIMPTAWLSPWGARVVTTELLYFSPLLVYALWPRFTLRWRARRERPARARPGRRWSGEPRGPEAPAERPVRTPPPGPGSSRASGAG